MADDVTNPTPAPQGDSQPDSDGTTDARTVPYQRFAQVNNAKKTAEARVTELEAQLAAAQPSDDFRTKYEAAAAELATLQRARLVDRALHRRGLPLDLAPRVRGDDEAAIDADVSELLRLGFGTVQAPNIGAVAKNDGPTGFTLAQVSDPNFYKANRDEIQRAQREGRIFG